jgi:hypothetical protein
LPPLVIPPYLIDVPQNYSWLTPYGGWVTFPGEPGSGFGTHSDYLAVSHLVTPAENAAHVREKLRSMGIPLVRPEPQFLGRNPRATEGVRLPVPLPKPEIEKKEEKKDDKEIEKDK